MLKKILIQGIGHQKYHAPLKGEKNYSPENCPAPPPLKTVMVHLYKTRNVFRLCLVRERINHVSKNKKIKKKEI